MNVVYKLAKRYLFFIISITILMVVFFINTNIGFKTIESVKYSLLQMISVLPPVMILLGLIDVWVPRSLLMKYLGDNSGITGIALAIIIGSIAAGPMYAAFPFTIVLLKKGAKFSNIIIFMNAWCVTKIPTLLFEISSLGFKFTLVRLLIDLPGIILMGYLVQYFIGKKELTTLYANACKDDVN